VRVFISWSGSRSRAVAAALRDWLPKTIQSIKPFTSSEDIAAGNRWQAEIATQLEASALGLVCVTRENQHAPWLNFEAGALAKTVERSRVVPLAVDLKPSDIEQPLGQFQAQPLSRDGIKKVLDSINEASDAPLAASILDGAFNKWWPELEAALAEAATSRPDVQPVRSERDLLEEILDIQRGVARQDAALVGEQKLLTFLQESMGPLPDGTRFTLDVERNAVTILSAEPVAIETQAAMTRVGRTRGIHVSFDTG
jgi:hypothetical protein